MLPKKAELRLSAFFSARKEAKLKVLEAQVEALRTMPEGSPLGDGVRVMKESRRAKFVGWGEKCLEEARNTDPSMTVWQAENLLFHPDL